MERKNQIIFFVYLVIIFILTFFLKLSDYLARYIFSIIILLYLLIKESKTNFENKMLLLSIFSAFLPKIFLPIIFNFFVFLIFGIKCLRERSKLFFNKNFLLLAGVIIFWAIVSWIYNNIFYEKDFWGIFFWILTFSFPFFVFIFAYNIRNIDKKNIENFYLHIILLELIIIFIKGIYFKRYFLEDSATGSCYNAHVLGVHIILGSFILLNRIYQKGLFKSLDTILFIIFNIGLIMTSTKAQTFIYFILLGFAIIYYLRLKSVYIIPILLVIFISSYLIFHKIYGIEFKNLVANKKYPKFYSYYLIFDKILKDKDMNILIGTGPAKYTSKASRLRMPSIADNRLPFIKIKEKKWKIFDKYIYQNFYAGEVNIKEYSLGTFYSPMTSINSIIVELGFIGFLLFLIFFMYILIQILKIKNFSLLLVYIFFMFNLFYLNYWEDPTFTIPVFILFGINLQKKFNYLNEK